MPSLSPMQRANLSGRSLTWPSATVRVAPTFSRGMSRTYMSLTDLTSPRLCTPSATLQAKPIDDTFENELAEHPDAHFLSPVQMYEYEDWASDSDSDPEEVAWDAGITDFALFDSDRRRAQERNEGVPDHWDSLLANQAMALRRAVERSRLDSSQPGSKLSPPMLEDMPQLTPDTSPQLCDNLDINARHPKVPAYLSSRITLYDDLRASSDEDLDDSISDMEYDDEYDDDDDDDDDYDTPIAVLLARARERQRNYRRLDRPGLRSTRTMSGKVHVWRRPSLHIYPVGEDVEAERLAEMLAVAEQTERASP